MNVCQDSEIETAGKSALRDGRILVKSENSKIKERKIEASYLYQKDGLKKQRIRT